MNTAASAQFQISSGAAQAFAIPAGQAAPIAAAIAAGRASAAVHIGATAFLGVQVVPYGVEVPGNPASAGAGVAGMVGNGRLPPGDTASLHWVDQAGQAHTATIVFAAGPAG